MTRVLIVEGVADLDKLITNPTLFSEIQLHIPGLSEAEATHVSKRLNGWAHECGCGAGGVAVLLALLVATPVWAWLWTRGDSGPLVLAGTALAVTVPAAVGAKVLVIMRARQSLRRSASVKA
jgi:hypothetical protein